VSAVGFSEVKVESQSEESLIVDISEKTTIQIEKLILSEFLINDRTFNIIIENDEIDANASIQTTTTKYKQIQGTVTSSSGIPFKDLQILDFKDSQILAFANFTFDTNLSLITGNNTTFTTDFIIEDIMLANNETFGISSIIDDTLVAVNRTPTNSFTNVFAYKIIP
jgi:hypothetical protein